MSAFLNVSQSRHSIHNAASNVYKRYPSLKEKETQLEEFREQLQKRVHELASSHLESQEALQKENSGYIQKKQSFRAAVTDVTQMEEILGNLDKGFDGLQPVPEKEPKPSDIEKTNKIEKAKTQISLQKLAFSQLKRRMQTSLTDVILLMHQFNAVVSGQDRQKSNEYGGDSSCPSTPVVGERGFYSTSTAGISSSSSPAFKLNERVFSDISDNNRSLALQAHPYSGELEEEETPRGALNQGQFGDSPTISTQITRTLDSIDGHLDDMTKIDQEGLKRIRQYISSPLDGEERHPIGKINSKPRTPPESTQVARRPSGTSSLPIPETPQPPLIPFSVIISPHEDDSPRLFLGESRVKKTERSCGDGFFNWLCCSGTRGKPGLTIETERRETIHPTFSDVVQNLDKHGIEYSKKKE